MVAVWVGVGNKTTWLGIGQVDIEHAELDFGVYTAHTLYCMQTEVTGLVNQT